MTASTPVQIHEFSTGIRPERTSDSWLSRGFTGQYMNATIEPIPYAVQRSIANKEFTVAEGASSSEPAIIGRVVLGSGESDWSVVAVVTRGRDEKGRPLSVYRYFLCEGADSLPKILAWIDSQRQIGRMPIFDPFDSKIVGQPNEWRGFNQLQVPVRDELQPLLRDTAPIIIPFGEPCTALIINEMATQKAKGQPIAWAYKVEALEQPGRFQVIYPASERAYDLLQRTKISTPQVMGGFIVADEQAIKSAIKGLISSSRVKPEHVQAIATALGTNIPEKYWQEIFDGQGAANALRQGIYSPQMVRLLTLRAIVMPETLPDYLSWMQNRGKQDDHYTISDEFQTEIKNCFKQIPGQAEDHLKISLIRGVKLIIARLIDRPELLDAVVSLLKTQNGLWSKFYFQEIIGDIDKDLNLMSRSGKGNQSLPFKMTDDLQWKKILGDLQNYWRSHSYPHQEKYQPFAQFFSRLDSSPQIAAFFYHVGYGVVPKKIFSQLRSAGWYTKIYGVTVERKVSVPEFLWFTILEVGGKIVPVAFVFPLIVVTFILGLLGGKIFLAEKSESLYGQEQKNTQPPNEPGDNPASSMPPIDNDQTSPPNKHNERDSFRRPITSESPGSKNPSYESLDQLISDFSEKQSLYNPTVEKKVLEILKLSKYERVTEIPENELEKAVYEYQSQNPKLKLNADGKISKPQTNDSTSAYTFGVLKCELAKKMNKTLPSPPNICQ